MTEQEHRRSWSEYYRKTAHRPPRALLLEALERAAAPGQAIDLGCGGGIETRELLRRGWHVLAVDQEPAAIEALAGEIAPAERARLTTQCASFAAMTLPPADLIWAGLSLPFAHPDTFPQLWTQITAALRPGGRIAADLFGVQHAWRARDDLTFMSLHQVQAYLHDFEIELLRESEEERPTAFEGMQHWHGFDIIARKPDSA